MRFDKVIYLISTTGETNVLGDAIQSSPSKRQTFARKDSIRQSEFYQSAKTDLKPELTFIVWTQEYNGEQELEYKGRKYTIIRTYEKNDKEIELICSGLVGG